MPNKYHRLDNFHVNTCCETCLSKYDVFNFKWNNNNVKCVLNDSRSVVLYPENCTPIRYNYRNIKRIEMRSCMKFVIVLDNSEIILKGFKRKSAFNKLRDYFQRQLIIN